MFPLNVISADTAEGSLDVGSAGITATDPGPLSVTDIVQFTIVPDSNIRTGTIRATDPGTLFADDPVQFTINPAISGQPGVTATDPGGLFITDPVQFTINPPQVGNEHPMIHNITGGVISNAISRFWDNTDPIWLWARVTFWNAPQIGSMWSASRAVRAQEWVDFHEDNPLGYIALHDTPFRYFTYRPKSNVIHQWRYDFFNNDRRDRLLHRSANDDDEIPFVSASSGSGAQNQPVVWMRLDSVAVQDHWSDIIVDLLTGANTTGRNMLGPDISGWVGYLNDGSPPVSPKFNRDVLTLKIKGSVTSVPGSGYMSVGQNIVQLSNQPNLSTSGSLAADPSFGAVVSPLPIGFHPSTASANGWSGHFIDGYKNVSGGRSEVYLRSYPSGRVSSTQFYLVSSGDLYNICNLSGTNNPDQDADGTGDNGRDAGNKIWSAGYDAIYNKADTKLVALVGHPSMRGHNAGGGIAMKRNGGLPHPHGGFRAMDYMDAENGDGAGKFEPNNASVTQEYELNNFSSNNLMRGIYFMESFIRPNPGGFLADKPRGINFDITTWSHGFPVNYAEANDPSFPGLMASYLRFYKALLTMVTNVNMGTTIETGYPILFEEAFLDFTPGWAAPAPIGTYDPTGGGNGTNNFPVGSWTWASGGVGDFTDNGRRIYVRRFGTRHLGLVNIGTPPGGRTIYKPSHLAGGDAARNPEDLIKPADWTSLRTGGMLGGGETLKKITPSTYVNATITLAMQAHVLTAAAWAGFNYGPRQPHPNDANNEAGSYTLANNPLIARDNTFNNGAAISEAVNFPLGALEGAILEIV